MIPIASTPRRDLTRTDRPGRTAILLAAVLILCALVALPEGDGAATALLGSLDRGWPGLLLYIGPDMLLPFTSALGAVAGVLMIFWQRIVAIARRLWRMVLRRPT